MWDWLKGGYLAFELKANDSLQFFFKVLSISHLREKLGLDENFIVNKISDNVRAHRRRIFPEGAENVGANIKHARKSCKYLLATPRGFKKNELAFDQECLLVSLILARENNYLLENRLTSQDKSSLSLQHYLKHSESGALSQMAGRNLLHKLNKLKCTLGLSDSCAPRDIQLCARVAALWQIQIVLFSSHTPPLVEMMFPSQFDLSLPPIFLLQTSEINSDCSHFDVIRNIKTFYNVRGFACVGGSCKYRSLRYRKSRHLCRSINCKACPCCHRTLKSKDTYVNKHLMTLYCDSAMCLDLNERCQDCNMLLLTKSCRQAHAGYFCRAKGKWCSECNRHVFPNHVCERRCRNCWKVKDSEHQCEVARPPQLELLPNVAFVSFESASCNARCLSCYGLQKKEHDNTLVCNNHLDHAVETKPICASVLYEDGCKELLSRVTFFDGDIERKEEKFVLKFSYLDHEKVDASMKALSRDRRSGRYGRPRGGKNLGVEENLAALSEMKNKSPVEQLLLFFLRPEFCNYTFVVSDYDGMTYLLRAITDCNFIPQGALNKGNRTVHFSTEFDIRFVCSAQYIGGSILQKIKHFGLEVSLTYFPALLWQQFRRDRFATLDHIPSFECFVDLADSKDIWQEKQRHWELWHQTANKWNPIEQLHQTSASHLDVLALSCLNFLKDSIKHQYDCLQQFGVPLHLKKGRLGILHPFSPFNGSLSSFMFDTFRHFAMKSETIYAIDHEYGRKMKTSRGELETTEMLRFFDRSWQTAYSSSKGQRCFKFENKIVCVPDAYNAERKVAFFFNGCRWHEHDCGHAKNSVISRKRRQEFDEKTKKLLKYFPEEVCCAWVVWECDWLKMRKNCPVIAEFLNEPIFRCVNRLRIRDAYKGQIVEAYALKYIKKPDDAEDFFILDISSLFPFTCLKYPFCVGKGRTIIGNELQQADVQMTENGMQYKSKRCYGVCQVCKDEQLSDKHV